jgi:hypothetical protein
MEHRPEELLPEIGLDKDHYKHRYLLITFEEKTKISENYAGKWGLPTRMDLFFKNPPLPHDLMV